MVRRTYGIDIISLTLAVALAAAIVMICALLVPEVAGLMMLPPLNGAQ
jgi:hypothetical protein